MTPPTIAIMQPYFIPYAGYFRLFAGSDLFVIYDCVQFPRRGWVHRNRLIDATGAERWLTLPLEKACREIPIRDLRFPPDAAEILAKRLRPFSLVPKNPAVRAVLDAVRAVHGTPVEYIEQLLEQTVRYLGFPWQVTRSSALNLPASLRGQDRILEIVRRLGFRRFVNAPGGGRLYSRAAFAEAGVDLCFLPPHAGPSWSILTRILNESRSDLRDEIRSTAVIGLPK